MKIDTDIELWIGDSGPEKYRVIIKVEAIKDYGTKKELIVNNEDTKRRLFKKFIETELV